VIFSVFDHDERRFHYYEAPGTSAKYDSRGTKYRALSQGPQGPLAASVTGLGGGGGRAGERVCIGFAPEALAIKLPSNARRVGSGNVARGIVASRVGGGGGLSGFGAVHHAPYAERFQGARPRMHDTEIRPAYPGKYEEEVCGVCGTGLGDVLASTATAPTSPSETNLVVTKTAFGQTVLAATIAAVVGVFVQRALNKRK